MKAVVMAGGEGTRLRPLTLNRPKPLVPVMNKPIMEHIVAKLNREGFDEQYSTLFFLAQEIQSYFGDGSEFGVSMNYVIEDKPLGTAGAVKQLESRLDETFVIISGDGLTSIDLQAAVRFHKERGSLATIVLTRVENPLEYGVVIIDDDGRIRRFLEKPGWGEVFSDTVNTGIYILEPEVFDYMEPDAKYDFSQNIFPAILNDKKPLFGYVAEGYWCDIGNLQQYRQAHMDVFHRRIELDIPGREVERDVWVGDGCDIDPKAVINGPVLIGKNCKVGAGARIDEFTVVGDNTIVGEQAAMHRSIVWNNNYIGNGVELDACIVCRHNTILDKAKVSEGSVIGDGCKVGRGATVQPQVKIWPDKFIEDGANVSMSLIWGQKWPGTLFSALGVRGVANVEITPDFATKLGAAYGAMLEKGATVITSRSTHKVTRVIKRAMIAGLMSVGVDVLDLRTDPLPMTRHAVRISGVNGGIHVRLSPYEPNQLLIEFFGPEGINVDKNKERKIENIFFREDFRRTDMNQVGELDFASRTLERYMQAYMGEIDTEAIRKAKLKVVIDCGFGSLATMLPNVLGRMGIEAVTLNAHFDANVPPVASALDHGSLARLSEIVKTLQADMGFLVDGEAEKLSLVDEQGGVISGDRLLALMVAWICETADKPKIGLQVRAPMVVERLAAELGGSVAYTKADSRSLMRLAHEDGEIRFAGDSKGGFMFPSFQPAFDAMIGIGKILEFRALRGRKLSEEGARIPDIFVESAKVACPWDLKGKVMRVLAEEKVDGKVELIDGIKRWIDDYWVLVRPDAAGPYFHVEVEAPSREQASQIARRYADRIEQLAGE